MDADYPNTGVNFACRFTNILLFVINEEISPLTSCVIGFRAVGESDRAGAEVLCNLENGRADTSCVNGGVKTCHWGGAKVGHFGVRALERVALK